MRPAVRPAVRSVRSLKPALARLVAVVLAVPLVFAPASQARATSAAYGCHIIYDITDWGTGFVVNLTLENTGTITFSPWITQFVYAGNQTVTQNWTANWSQTPPSVQATNPSYWPDIAPGTSRTIGFVATYSGSNPDPTGFTINGVPCTVTIT